MCDAREESLELRIAPLAEFAHWIPDIAQWLHKELGVKKLYLYTPTVEQFYSLLGWQVLERTRYREIPVTVMYYSLQQEASSHG